MESMTGELSEKEIIRQERNAGFISDRVREIQVSTFFKCTAQTHAEVIYLFIFLNLHSELICNVMFDLSWQMQ